MGHPGEKFGNLPARVAFTLESYGLLRGWRTLLTLSPSPGTVRCGEEGGYKERQVEDQPASVASGRVF